MRGSLRYLPPPRFSGDITPYHKELYSLEEEARRRCEAEPYFTITPNYFYYRWKARNVNLAVVSCGWRYTKHGYLLRNFKFGGRSFYVEEGSDGRLVFYGTAYSYATLPPPEHHPREPCTPVERIPNALGVEALERYKKEREPPDLGEDDW